MPGNNLRTVRTPMEEHVQKFRMQYLPYIRKDVKKLFNEFRTLHDIYDYLFEVFFVTLYG